ncbi:Cytosol aminopeptidase [Astathelohania contejeani]|uniref:Cytosol aminopeptidase n=1 Tax=Astathelohania contejeani TaxID=164912 RepID=A0ABQ7HY36_9MICR|nr:Cytosol aminopeptidase [Thelohania contejeani]
MLNWKKIFEIKEKKETNKNGLVITYRKIETGYEYKTTCPSTVLKKISNLMDKHQVKGKLGDVTIYEPQKEDNIEFKYIAVCCMGDDDTNLFINIRRAVANGVKKLKALGVEGFCIDPDYRADLCVEGAILSLYEYSFLKKDKKDNNFCVYSYTKCSRFDRIIEVAMAQNFARFLADTPANLMTPTLFVEYSKEYLNSVDNIEVKVYDKNYLEEKKMGLFLSVAQGSEQPPKFLFITYNGRGDSDVDLALVGKGITFDSGGISLKPSAKMSAMKADMLGAASVLSVVGAAARLKRKINIIVAIPLTENLPSGKATKPGDVFIGMSGISVEVDNTDAEGRLVLADALTYVQEFNPKYIVDVATLTGAICVALGTEYIGMFTNDDSFGDLIEKCGIEVEDRVWKMPLNKNYLKKIESSVADLMNSGGRSGGSCTAAIFLNEFVNKEFKWAHLDIAGVMDESPYSELYGKGMTGKPVRLLYDLIEKIEMEKNK